MANDIPANRSRIPARRERPPRNVIPSGRGGLGFETTRLASTGRLIEDLWGLKIWVLPQVDVFVGNPVVGALGALLRTLAVERTKKTARNATCALAS